MDNIFKIDLIKFINNYPKIKNSSLSLLSFQKKKIFENDYRNFQRNC